MQRTPILNYVCYIIALLSLASTAAAQQCDLVLRGRVIDEHDEQPLAAAAVFLLNQGIGAYTDVHGYFELGGVCLVADSLRTSHIGCETSVQAFTRKSMKALAGKDTSLTIYLEHHTEMLQGVVVHTHRNQASSTDIGTQLSGEQLDRTAGSDFADVIVALPGVNLVSTGANTARPTVDGLGGSRLQIVQGGVVLASQDWGDEHALEIDPFAAANIQLARAGATTRYGTATTGASLVLHDPRIPTNQELRGQALTTLRSNNNTLAGGVNVAQRINSHLGYRSQLTTSSSGDSRAPDYVLSNTGARRHAGQLRVYYQDSSLSADVGYRGFYQELGVLRAAHVGNLTDLQRAINSDTPLVIEPFTRAIDAPRQVAVHHWFTANAAYQLEKSAELRLTYSYQQNEREEFDRRRSGRSATPTLDLTLGAHDVRAEYVHRAMPHWGGRTGLQANTAENRNDPNTGAKPFIPFYNTQTVGAYTEQRWTSEQLTLEFNGRLDFRQTYAKWFDRTEQGNKLFVFDASELIGAAAVGAERRWSEWSARARLAYASRTPNPAERFADGVHHALATIEQGDTTLRIEHALKATVGLSYEDQEGLEVFISGFMHRFNDFIYQRQLPDPALTVRGAFPVLAYEQNDATLVGVDVDAHLPLSKFLRLDVRGNYLRGTLATGEPLPDISPVRFEAEFAYAKTANERLKDWRISLIAMGATRQSRIPNFLLAPPPRGYTLLAASLGGHLALGKTNVLGVHLRVNNLLNKAYRDYLDRLRFYADKPGRDVQLRLLYDF